MFSIDITTDIAAPLPRALRAITTESGFRGWFAEDADFDGQRAIFRFPQKDAQSRSVTLVIERSDASSTVMTCVDHENNPDWLGTRLSIALSETANGVRVHLVHSGYPAKNEVYERCCEAWPYFLRSLEQYLVTGTGQPYPKGSLRSAHDFQ